MCKSRIKQEKPLLGRDCCLQSSPAAKHHAERDGYTAFFEVTMTLTPDKRLAAALGRIPSGLFILTLRRDEIETGMLASWVQQCSFAPPCVSVAIQKGREIGTLLTPQSLFCLNILEEGQTDLIAHFGRGFTLKEDAFVGLHVRARPSGRGHFERIFGPSRLPGAPVAFLPATTI